MKGPLKVRKMDERMTKDDAKTKSIRQIQVRFSYLELSVKGVRSFIGMANYFRDFVKGLSSHMIPLTAFTKKRSTSEPFKMTQEGRCFRAYQGTFG